MAPVKVTSMNDFREAIAAARLVRASNVGRNDGAS
jgi:hypothetical protein